MYSCEESFLDQTPYDSYNEKTVFQDLRVTELFLDRRYKSALETFVYIFGFAASSDEAFSKWDWFNEKSWVQGQVTPDMSYMNNIGFWSEKYSEIRDLNMFIEKIDDTPGDTVWRNRQKGEAIFLRAYSYFDLLRRYGGVPLILTQLNPDGNIGIRRNTYDEVAKFIIDECIKASLLLPYIYDEANLGRVTKGAALALKARMLLYWASPHNNPGNDLSRWQSASDATRAVIDLTNEDGEKVYSLYEPDDYRSVFMDGFNSEIIFCRQQNGITEIDDGNNNDLINSPNGYHGWSTFEPTQNLVDEFEMSNGLMINEPGSGYKPNDPYTGREKRFYANILYDSSFYRDRYIENWIITDTSATGVVSIVGGGKDTQKGKIENWNYSSTCYNMRKYMDESRDINTFSSVKAPLFRLSEMYLNFAEAQNMLGHDEVAREYLNYIRQRHGVDLPAVSNGLAGEALRDKIRHERKIELLWENHRFFDVRRWGILLETDSVDVRRMEISRNPDGTKKYIVKIEQERQTDEKYYLLPIHREEMERTTGLEQNPGY